MMAEKRISIDWIGGGGVLGLTSKYYCRFLGIETNEYAESEVVECAKKRE